MLVVLGFREGGRYEEFFQETKDRRGLQLLPSMIDMGGIQRDKQAGSRNVVDVDPQNRSPLVERPFNDRGGSARPFRFSSVPNSDQQIDLTYEKVSQRFIVQRSAGSIVNIGGRQQG